VGYFFALTNKAKIQPIKDQPNISDPMRVRIWSYFEREFADARYAGVKTIHINIVTSTTYFNISKIPFKVIIYYIPYFAFVPNSSAMRISWLYFAMRSVRDIEPVFICPAFVATAKSAIVVSSVSPLRCETMTP